MSFKKKTSASPREAEEAVLYQSETIRTSSCGTTVGEDPESLVTLLPGKSREGETNLQPAVSYSRPHFTIDLPKISRGGGVTGRRWGYSQNDGRTYTRHKGILTALKPRKRPPPSAIPRRRTNKDERVHRSCTRLAPTTSLQ